MPRLTLHCAILLGLAVQGGASMAHPLGGETIHRIVALSRLNLNVPSSTPADNFPRTPCSHGHLHPLGKVTDEMSGRDDSISIARPWEPKF